MPILECFGLVKDYPGKRAVDGIDFFVEKGEIVGLLGPNGAGKTTTFRMACGLISATEGRVILAGDDVTNWPMYKRARHGMGFLPQDDSIFRKLTVEQNIRAILEYLSVGRREREHRISELLEQFGLDDKRKQVSATLSGGERRRLEIARCLASKPSLILLDEPFTGIDPVTIHSIQDIITDLCRSGISILLTDHRERETLTVTDRSYIICSGNVVVTGDAKTVLNDPTAQDLYFGRRFDATSIIEGKEAFGKNSQRQPADPPQENDTDGTADDTNPTEQPDEPQPSNGGQSPDEPQPSDEPQQPDESQPPDEGPSEKAA